ncbi:MAG: M23 family metallopeptidase [bacterium]|nr:M23 family metallopeptidase [bacterium]
MKKLILPLLFLLSLLPLLLLPPSALASAWVYPMDKFAERITIKSFGQLIDNNFYLGKEDLFPNKRYFGYHTGVDLEVFPNEENSDVPIYAVASGTITYIGYITGYGGLILENFGDHTALYGHLKLSSITLKKGEKVDAGQQLALLGNAFSTETDGERKHLHFGIYKGSDLYFKGHETSLSQLQNKWEDPEKFLSEKGAVSPTFPTTTLTPTPIPTTPSSFWDFIINMMKKFLISK